MIATTNRNCRRLRTMCDRPLLIKTLLSLSEARKRKRPSLLARVLRAARVLNLPKELR